MSAVSASAPLSAPRPPVLDDATVQRLKAELQRRKDRKRQRTTLFVVLAVVAVLACGAIAWFYPHLQASIGAFVVAGLLLWLRSKVFHVEGVQAMPFARFTRLLAGKATPSAGRSVARPKAE